MSETSEGVVRKRPLLGCAGVAGIVAVVVFAGVMIGGQISEAGKYAVQGECVRLVAEWAGVSEADVRSEKYGTSRVALDYKGTYPGGEWACAGEIDRKEPHQVIVYPDDPAGEGGVIYPKG